MFTAYEKIKYLADKQGISLNKIEEKLGYSRNTIYNMRKSTPNSERIAEIANYFNVSTDYLLGRTDNPRIATSNDKPSHVDLKELAKESFFYDGRHMESYEIDMMTAWLDSYYKNKDKD
ncbi:MULTISPECIES: helix-turn-helix domain-containing protein [Streptococcus]|uniref:helix-turn-helix domain-containing protein n=1 Tax=Streptococcus TaxID=1301 RepID=UPI00085C5300|nr:helix-turn-helix domain-containing protein [Streptococcus agalactiae]